MNPRYLELALKKQRLQLRGEVQRERFLEGLEAAERIEAGVHRLRGGLLWAREHAPLLSGTLLLLVALRPRVAWRLARRGWVGWLLYRRVRGALVDLGMPRR